MPSVTLDAQFNIYIQVIAKLTKLLQIAGIMIEWFKPPEFQKITRLKLRNILTISYVDVRPNALSGEMKYM